MAAKYEDETYWGLVGMMMALVGGFTFGGLMGYQWMVGGISLRDFIMSMIGAALMFLFAYGFYFEYRRAISIEKNLDDAKNPPQPPKNAL